MTIQIFGTPKSFDVKKAQRYFKERRIQVHFIDIRQKPLSKGELTSVMRAVGGAEALIDPDCKDAYALTLVQHTPASMLFDKLLENQQVLRLPIVRNGQRATVGYAPQTWSSWQ
ncbi:ArsC family transcriptional regulator [Eggerthellaceae bacterium zg-1084]|uniref:ArsC family transcriptional regulator n=1 Tax=Berryella wangjianweii TaxID=2734634 RepID=A0A6M8J019_9ACTN|nr:ArsC/Spx/MgsR family protein [Berryella wangjianweii]NPD31370.1 ArsC family transcriptional regulator [Berryella wangjianweii]NPD32323.1 ArsC family transcriptional regulator [Eggerthellaceae bacterium zg-997]QKF06907.1 ArsC family transcriptional regulator [Berryella wangjianweii]